jgi:molecular chaperone GrpE
MTKKIKKDNMTEKIKELENGWRRTQADFENYRKRTDEQKFELVKQSHADFMTKITPVLDNFKRAFAHAPENDKFSDGIKQIEKQLEEILVAEGLTKIDAKPGIKFDHNLHEAISYEENELSVDCIISELESGWEFNGRVIKPAKVRVSKGK